MTHYESQRLTAKCTEMASAINATAMGHNYNQNLYYNSQQATMVHLTTRQTFWH